MTNLIVRASDTDKLMANGRAKDSYGETMLTWLKEKAVFEYFGIKKEISTKQMIKGIVCEQQLIDLLNSITFESYKKNEQRFVTDMFAGTPDIISGGVIRDIKSSWSAETFPWMNDDAQKIVKKNGYDWQVRVYMMLTNSNEAWVDHCLVDTPDDLLADWDDWNLHKVEHIPITKRITSVRIERDKAIEVAMIERYGVANEIYQGYLNELINK